MTEEAGPPGALARLRHLNATLLGARSATVALERWFDRGPIGGTRHLVAEHVETGPARTDAARRRRLGIGPFSAVRYRRVRLRLGATVLSEAENWYVPSRLTAPMNRLLDRTQMPFGRAVRALGFRRRTLSRHLLWDGGVLAGPQPPRLVLRHHAVLVRRDGVPFSEVIETYTAAVLEPVPDA